MFSEELMFKRGFKRFIIYNKSATSWQKINCIKDKLLFQVKNVGQMNIN